MAVSNDRLGVERDVGCGDMTADIEKDRHLLLGWSGLLSWRSETAGTSSSCVVEATHCHTRPTAFHPFRRMALFYSFFDLKSLKPRSGIQLATIRLIMTQTWRITIKCKYTIKPKPVKLPKYSSFVVLQSN